jgi:hypothetical protein
MRLWSKTGDFVWESRREFKTNFDDEFLRSFAEEELVEDSAEIEVSLQTTTRDLAHNKLKENNNSSKLQRIC